MQIQTLPMLMPRLPCAKGVISYEMDPLSGITENWIVEHVVPNMVSHDIPHQVCIVFGCAVLFRWFDKTGKDAVPTPMRESIKRAYHDFGARHCLEDSCNPVKKRPLVVTGYGTEVTIDIIEGEDDGGGHYPCRFGSCM